MTSCGQKRKLPTRILSIRYFLLFLKKKRIYNLSPQFLQNFAVGFIGLPQFLQNLNAEGAGACGILKALALSSADKPGAAP